MDGPKRYSIEGRFDLQTEGRVRALIHAVDLPLGRPPRIGVEGCPHLSLGILQEGRPEMFVPVVEHMARRQQTIALELLSVSTFRGTARTVFLATNACAELVEMQKRLHRTSGPGWGTWDDYYLPENWVPHVTICEHVPAELLEDIAQVARGSDVLGEIRLEALSVVVFPPAAELAAFPLLK